MAAQVAALQRQLQGNQDGLRFTPISEFQEQAERRVRRAKEVRAHTERHNQAQTARIAERVAEVEQLKAEGMTSPPDRIDELLQERRPEKLRSLMKWGVAEQSVGCAVLSRWLGGPGWEDIWRENCQVSPRRYILPVVTMGLTWQVLTPGKDVP